MNAKSTLADSVISVRKHTHTLMDDKELTDFQKEVFAAVATRKQLMDTGR